MRRTKLQRQMHRQWVEELLVKGYPGGQIVRGLVQNFELTLRQARLDLKQVQAEFRRQDDELRQNRWKLQDLAIASDRCDREFLAAVEAGDARRAMRVEKHRCKLLGIYEPDRSRVPHLVWAERMAIMNRIKSDIVEMYDEAPRNPDGSVVLTHFSLTPPPVDDPRYCRVIEQPLARGISPRRRERIETMRAMLAAGGRMDQLEAAARKTYRLSSRQVRADVRILQDQLEYAGQVMHNGTHDVQLLPLALQRRERIIELALKPQGSHLPPRDEKAAAERVADSPRESEGKSERTSEAKSDGTSEAKSERTSEGKSDGNSQSELPTPSDGAPECSPLAPRDENTADALGKSKHQSEPTSACKVDGASDGNSQSELPTRAETRAECDSDAEREILRSAQNDRKASPKAAKPKPPDWRLAAEVEVDRCRLLGLYPRDRPKPDDDQLLWKPPVWDLPAPAAARNGGLVPNSNPLPPASPWDQPGPYANLPQDNSGGPGGRLDNLPYGRPLSAFERQDSELDRLIEHEFARFDARRGIRHTVAELLLDRHGRPGTSGREAWKPREGT